MYIHVYSGVLYTHIVEYYSTIEKNEILQFMTTWVDLDSIMLSEKVSERQILYDFT